MADNNGSTVNSSKSQNNNSSLVQVYDDLVMVNASEVPAPFWNAKEVKRVFDKNSGAGKTEYQSGVLAPMSLFNEMKQMRYVGMSNSFASTSYEQYFDHLRARGENPMWSQIEPTVPNIIKAYEDTVTSKYKITDFLYNKFYGKIPNNYLITLRRYPMPTIDSMFSIGSDFDSFTDEFARASQFAIATATTYFGELPGNNMSDILKFSFGTNWNEQTSQISTLTSQQPGFTGFGVGASMFNNIGKGTMPGQGNFWGSNLKSASSNMAVSAWTSGNSTTFEGYTQQRESAAHINPWEKYGNRSLGPVDVIMQTNTRAQGLNFTNDFNLKFDYSLASLNYVNPRIAMLDIIGNMVLMGTMTGDWWGGATRFYGNGGGFGRQLGDVSLLRKGDYIGYFEGVGKNVATTLKNIAGIKDGDNFNVIDIAKNILGGLAKNFLGSLINDKLGKVGQAQSVPALLSDEPTAYWHVVLGNPLNPILVAGNMICNQIDMTMGSGLGYDDFPMEVSFTATIKHGKPRDAAGIESMFNAAKGRYYMSPYLGDDDLDPELRDAIASASAQLNSADRDPMLHVWKNRNKGKSSKGTDMANAAIKAKQEEIQKKRGEALKNAVLVAR